MVRCKTLKFLARKNHSINVHRRFLATTGIKPEYNLAHSEQIKTENTSIARYNFELSSTIIVCTKHEQYSVGAAETAVNNLRHSTREMMLLGIIPKRFWHFVIAHAAYIAAPKASWGEEATRLTRGRVPCGLHQL